MPKRPEIKTKTKCLPIFCKNYDKKIKGYIYKQRKSELIKPMKLPSFKLSEKLSSLKQKDIDAIKDHIDETIVEWRYVEKKQYKKPKYCIDKQLITKKEKKRFAERNQI